jgi:hypothetical protein
MKRAVNAVSEKTSCAAGTGSFLDQQARRLNLQTAEALSRRAICNRGNIPKIATRCAVFAKTDLVHAQQEGYTLDQICDGLCHGLAKNIVDTLSMDRELNGPIIFTGGVSKNRAVVHHIQSITGKDIIVDEECIYAAIGAAFLLAGELRWEDISQFRSMDDILVPRVGRKKYYHDALRFTLSDYPEFSSAEQYEFVDDKDRFFYPVEVDIFSGRHGQEQSPCGRL